MILTLKGISIEREIEAERKIHHEERETQRENDTYI